MTQGDRPEAVSSAPVLYHCPQNTVRWSWKVGDMVIWDNRAARHYPIDDKQSGLVYRDNLTRDLSPSVNGHRGGQRGNMPRPPAARAA
ncbi:TauD/TfdA family dioxygenase [Bradyrhizobium sp. CCBAU 45394]|uniref:TauD/TfdA family dioxygenase n=1 Tax=Bradyrhizobium sp. CCBAU 45394 TaxID=1325087 RepID=UPI002FE32126